MLWVRVLTQPRTPKAFEIVVAVGVMLQRHLARDPGQRNIGLDATEFAQGRRGDVWRRGHAGGRGKYAVAGGVIAAQADGSTREPHRLLVIATDVLRQRGRTIA